MSSRQWPLQNSSIRVTLSSVRIIITYSILDAQSIANSDPKKWTDLQVREFKPKTFESQDVELAITHCGVCGSDVHTLTQGWGKSQLPLVVGHEIIGIVTRVGDKVKDFKPGDRVGVGAQRGSCMSCRACKDGYENYCPKGIDTYVCILFVSGG